MKIRQATIDDIEVIAKIEQTCFPPLEAASLESLTQRVQAFDDCFFVGEIDHQIIGFINGCVCNETTIKDELYNGVEAHHPEADYQMIFGLDVLPEYRRLGYAKALMNYMIEDAKKRRKKGIALTCKKELIPFYESFGYQNQGVSQSLHGGVTWYDMFLTL